MTPEQEDQLNALEVRAEELEKRAFHLEAENAFLKAALADATRKMRIGKRSGKDVIQFDSVWEWEVLGTTSEMPQLAEYLRQRYEKVTQ